MSTNELEKQFFDIFGIEPKSVKRTLKLAMPGYDESDLPEDLKQFISSQAQVYRVYPQITDHILLELICICSQYGFCPSARNIEDLKLKVLKRLLELKKSLKNNYEHQGCHNAFTRKVRTLFKGGNNG